MISYRLLRVLRLLPLWKNQIERGHKNPSLKSLTKIADALGVPVAVLMSDSRREIQVDEGDVLRRELLALTQGKSPDELRKLVDLARVLFR